MTRVLTPNVSIVIKVYQSEAEDVTLAVRALMCLAVVAVSSVN